MSKVCIPTIGSEGMEARINPHFGSSPYFTLVDLQSAAVEIVANGNQHHEHGQCNPIGAIAGKGVGTVICGGIGQGAINRLQENGIKVFMAHGTIVKDVVALFATGQLREVTPGQACAAHDCH